MKKSILILIFSLFLYSAHSQVETYFSSGWEMIFSFATVEYTIVDDEGTRVYDKGNIMRWAPVLNLQGMYNVNLGKAFGLFTGLAVRNVGFIYDIPETSYKFKYRTYNLGLPIGLKIGNMKGFFLYGGYEIEYAFNYKEKRFENNSGKVTTVHWFTDRVTQFPQSFLVGINFPYGFNLKFKYYINNFHNQDFIDGYTADGEPIKPYEDLKSNVFYISLNFGLFNPFKKSYDPKTWDDKY